MIVPKTQHRITRFLKGEAAVSWLETIAITGAIPAAAFFVNPTDPFLLESDFPWIILAPILLGCRYGFAHGFGSALVLVAGLGMSWHFGYLPTAIFPTSLSLGLIFTGIVTGEFGQFCLRRHDQHVARYNYLQTRFDEFSRVYQVLKVSHARLEQQVAGAPVSLRTSLLKFREFLSTCQFNESVPLGGVGESILQIFRECGAVQIAALYQVVSPFGVDLTPAARLGMPPALVTSNPLVQEVLRTGQTVSIKVDDFSAAEDGILAVVPLVDVKGQIWGVVTINEMPFVDFQQNSTLDLLTIVGGYIGDIIRVHSGGGKFNQKALADNFQSQLERCLTDVRRHQLPAGLVTLDVGNQRLPGSLVKQIQAQSRGLDTVWVPGGTDKSGVICTLLPLTDEDGVAIYIQKLKALVKEQDTSLADTDVAVSGKILGAKHSASELIEEIEKIAKRRTETRKGYSKWRDAEGA